MIYKGRIVGGWWERGGKKLPKRVRPESKKEEKEKDKSGGRE